MNTDRQKLREKCTTAKLQQRKITMTREQFNAAINIAITDAAANAIMLCKAALRGHAGPYFVGGMDTQSGRAILEAISIIDSQHIIESCKIIQAQPDTEC